MGEIVGKEFFSYMLTSFPVPAFFIGPDKPGDAFQALDHVTGSGQIGFQLSNPTLERLQGIGGWYFWHTCFLWNILYELLSATQAVS
jgi:hypothetical protein